MSRDSERSRAAGVVADFLTEAGRCAAGLLIRGEAGIGKTTLALEATAMARAAGFRVVGSRVGRPETTLSYSALGDLLERVTDHDLAALPEPQQEALSAALLRSTGSETVQDPRAVSLATLSVVRRWAEAGPLLIAIDDLQWLDASSVRVIEFVLRRLELEPVGVLATQRTGEEREPALELEHSITPGRLMSFTLGPMELGTFGHLLHTRVDAGLPHSLVLRIHELSEGNPFYGLEMAREVVRRGVPEPGEPLPLDADTFAVVRRRILALPASTRAVLIPAALTSPATVDVLRRTVPQADVEGALAQAESEALVTVRHGIVAFTHPIFASAMTATTPPPDLRSAHGRLAEVLDNPEQQARHLALSTIEPDERIAQALDRGLESARRRGAAAAAAELALMALAHTPPADSAQRTHRCVVAGRLAFEAGDAVRAHVLLNRILEASTPGPARATVMVTLCEICWQDTVEVEALARAALDEPGVDREAEAGAHLMLAWVWLYRGDLARAEAHVTRSGSVAGSGSTTASLSDLLTVSALTSFLAGRRHQELIEEAVALEDQLDPAEDATIYTGARVTRALILMWGGELDAAQTSLEEELARLESRNRYVARDEILCYLAHVDCRTGRWERAQQHAEESLEIGEQSGHLRGRGQNIVPRAWLSALRGDLDSARRDALEGLTLSTRFDDRLAIANCRGVLGLAALSEADHKTAAGHLQQVVAFLLNSEIVPTDVAPFVADAIEALVGTGRLDEAEAITRNDRIMGRTVPGGRPAATVARGAAAVRAARGDLTGAVEALQGVLTDPQLVARPFERARTLVVAADVKRRSRHRSEARSDLVEALTTFRRLGAKTWADRTAAELARTYHAAPDDLTPTEGQLVNLVAEGLTNREAAERLFLSVKTVEANLSRVYRKLGVRSRGELVRRVLTDAPPAPQGPTARPEGFL